MSENPLPTNNTVEEYDLTWKISCCSSKWMKPVELTSDAHCLSDYFNFKVYFSIEYNARFCSQKLFLNVIDEEYIPDSSRAQIWAQLSNITGDCLASSTSQTKKNFIPIKIHHKILLLSLESSKIIRNLKDDVLVVKCSFALFHHVTEQNCNTLCSLKSMDSIYKFLSIFRELYDSQIHSDLSICTGNTIHKAHRAILVAHSSVFKTMLSSDFQEAKSGCLTITDVDSDIFGYFLKYLYCGDLEDKSFNTMLELYSVAHKYAVSNLQEECRKVLVSLLSVDNSCAVLTLAHVYSDLPLKNGTIPFITGHFTEIKSSSEWKDMIKNHPDIMSGVFSQADDSAVFIT